MIEIFGAGNENRTHNYCLGSSRFTTKLYPQVLFYVILSKGTARIEESTQHNRYFFFSFSGTASTSNKSKSTLSTKSRGLKRVLLNITK